MRAPARRAVAALAVAALSFTVVATSPRPAVAATSTAVVVVDYQGSVHTSVISFGGSVSGLTALQLAGANPVTLDYGPPLNHAVCQLYAQGDAPSPSSCPGGWVYFRSTGSSWSKSGAGASNTSVGDGDVQGWKYGGGAPGSSASFCDHVSCAPPPADPPPPAPTAAPAPVPTAAPFTPGAIPTPSVTTAPTAGKGKAADSASDGDGSESIGTKDDGDKAKSDGGKTEDKAARTTKHDHDQAVALGSTDADDGGSGSPLGVLIVVGILVAISAVVVVQRRRTGRAPSS